MSVDYDAYYGIGYEVEANDELEGSEYLDDSLNDYVCCNLGEGFSSFQTGNCFAGDFDGVFITIDTPFMFGLDLSESKKILDTEIKRLKLDSQGNFGVVGGLLVW